MGNQYELFDAGRWKEINLIVNSYTSKTGIIIVLVAPRDIWFQKGTNELNYQLGIHYRTIRL